jgi:hypothetical protein
MANRNLYRPEHLAGGDGKVGGNLEVGGSIVLGSGNPTDDVLLENVSGALQVNGEELGASAVVGARVFLSANETVAIDAALNMEVPYDTEVYDTDGFFNPASPGDLIIPAGLGGLYRIEANVSVNANPTFTTPAYISMAAIYFREDPENEGVFFDLWPAEQVLTLDPVHTYASGNLSTEVVLEEGDRVVCNLSAAVPPDVGAQYQVSGQAASTGTPIDSYANGFSIRRIGDAPA